MHAIELKIGMNYIGYIILLKLYCRSPLVTIDFGEFWINSFFTGVQKNSYAVGPVESNSVKCSSIQMVHSIEVKFGMYFIGHHPTYCVVSNLVKFRMNSLFTGAQKRILIHYSLWSQIIRN